MIPRSLPLQQTAHWQNLLAEAISDPRQLLEALDLDPSLLPAARQATEQFRLRVPRGFLSRMRKGDPEDPLLRQVLPLQQELVVTPGFSTDPLDELRSMPAPGVLHKYHGRALLTLTGACGVHCRYCFRRHYPYGESNPVREHWPATLDYLGRQTDIREVILSGGDPLSIPDPRLKSLVNDLETIPHITRLRIHSRLPVVLPERVDDALSQWITQTRLHVVLVIHANHGREIDSPVRQAMARMKGAGVTLLNQSVLLRKVNDDPAVLVELSERLFAAGVLPYYLHQLDPVQGAAHFGVDDQRANQLVTAIRRELPGYLVPRLVRELPGQPSKMPV